MGRIDKHGFSSWLSIGVVVPALILLLVYSSGCSTASWVVHRNPPASDLFVTEADVDAVIEELSKTGPKDPVAVLYNQTTDRYELKPETYKKALRDGIIKRIQDQKIRAFLEDYRPETFGEALKKDVGTAGILVVLLGILAGILF